MISSILKPSISLGFLANQIGQKLNKKVSEYKIFYQENSTKINPDKPGQFFNLFFIVDDIIHPFDDDGKISFLIKEQLKDHVKDKNIEAFIIDYNKNGKTNISAQIFYTYEDSNGKTIKEKFSTTL